MNQSSPSPENPILNEPDCLLVFHKVCSAVLSDLMIHEFNNVLTGLSGYTQMAARARDPQMVGKSLKALEDGVGRLIEGIRGMLAFTRGNISEQKPFEVHESISLVNRLLNYHLSRRNVEVLLDPVSTPLVHGNAALFQTMLLALFLDSRDRIMATGAPGTIHIRQARFQDRLRIEFRDSVACPVVGASSVPSPADENRSSTDAMRLLAPGAVRWVLEKHRADYGVEEVDGHPTLVVEIPVFIG